MSYMIPAWELATKAKEQYRRSSAEILISRALFLRYALDRNELYVHEILPSDLGLERWQTPKQGAQTTVTWVDCNLTNKVIGIIKVVQLTENPAVTKISLIRGGALASYHQLTSLYGLVPLLKKLKETDLELLQLQYGIENLSLEGWFSEPWILEGKVQIDVTSDYQSTDGDKLVLVGFKVEPVIIQKEEQNEQY